MRIAQHILFILVASLPVDLGAADVEVDPRAGRAVLTAAPTKVALICDDDELAKCLGSVDKEFEEECEPECKKKHPNDAGKYNECRNECREIRDNSRQGCYNEHCEDEAKQPQ